MQVVITTVGPYAKFGRPVVKVREPSPASLRRPRPGRPWRCALIPSSVLD